uniref:Uncharacterized protein n=1 Tax=Utricularia reniformis TaxID=192314 RepID=A0A1Y0B2H2_9LAMI|nr:hypothetical protein AEK19_MT1391 [Utricularia reniformis]ART31587.1 hypothetical protein AEK19_MT1391 [Utricularia reniformis]
MFSSTKKTVHDIFNSLLVGSNRSTFLRSVESI